MYDIYFWFIFNWGERRKLPVSVQSVGSKVFRKTVPNKHSFEAFLQTYQMSRTTKASFWKLITYIISRRIIGRTLKNTNSTCNYTKLLKRDFYRRHLKYCLWALQNVEDNEVFFILFYFQTKFLNNGLVNRPNFHN